MTVMLWTDGYLLICAADADCWATVLEVVRGDEGRRIVCNACMVKLVDKFNKHRIEMNINILILNIYTVCSWRRGDAGML